MPIDPAIIAIVCPSFVAVAALALPLFFNWLHERQKIKDAREERLAKATAELLHCLTVYDSIGYSADKKEQHKAAYQEMMGKYWFWDALIRPKCKGKERETLNGLRSSFNSESVNSNNARFVSDLVASVSLPRYSRMRRPK